MEKKEFIILIYLFFMGFLIFAQENSIQVEFKNMKSGEVKISEIGESEKPKVVADTNFTEGKVRIELPQVGFETQHD